MLGRTSALPQAAKNLVIPNRAESPVRNLLFADTTTNRGCPIACPERSRRVSRLLRDMGFHDPIPLMIRQRHDREGDDFSRAARPQEKEPRPAGGEKTPCPHTRAAIRSNS